jgi:enediyne biosynthesis protein E4
MKTNHLLILLLCIIFFSCKNDTPLFSLIPSSESGITFKNTVTENEVINLYDFHNMYNGAGVAIGDINNDNLPDIFFTANMTDDKLYLNKGNLRFEDISEKAGILKKNNDNWSTGVTMADVNADGLLDIYVCKSGNYDAKKRANQLYINKGNLGFEESAERFGLADTSYSSQAAFFDYDKDGDLDMYLLTTTNQIRNPNQITIPKNDGTGFSVDKLFRNDINSGKQKFTDVSKQAGILHDGNGLGLAICDLNDDGWEDVLVSNDFLPNDQLYINNHDGTFTESAKTYFKHHSRFSMGNDVADVNNDGKMDVLVVDMLPTTNQKRKKMTGPGHYEQYEVELKAGYHPQFMRNMFHLNLGKTPDGNVHFSEIGQLVGIHQTNWSWSPLFADFDNDGLKDLFVSNGYLRDLTDLDFIAYNMAFAEKGGSKSDLRRYMIDNSLQLPSLNETNFFFKNTGNLEFENSTEKWFQNLESLSNGAAYADLDNDGDLDLVINNVNAEAFILRNNSENTNFLKIKLKGNQGNLLGLGSEITVYHQGKIQKHHHSVSRGYASSVDYEILFGLGNDKKIDSLEIVWTNDKRQILTNITSNQTLTLDYKAANLIKNRKETPSKTLLKDISDELNLDFIHQEEPYMDYNVEPLLLHKLSQQSPKMTVGDVNGDNLEDFFVGGSFGHNGKIFIQTKEGRFIKKSFTDESKPKNQEDIGVKLFDADQDGDQDLYIVSGSNEFLDNSDNFQDRFYLNDGKGNFTDKTNQLPIIRQSGSCVAVADFDKDGDLDIFRGGRLTPTQYPLAGSSYLLQNDKGSFIDFTQFLSPEIQKIGMVTDAIWTDIDNDSWQDLVIVGEFMPIVIFKNENGKKLTRIETNLNKSNGLWNCIKSGDFDKDGDIDLIAGNFGLNTRYRFSEKEPLSIYADDFDGNGRIDAIPSYFINHVEYPIPSRDELLRQIPSMRAKFLKYADYANARMDDVLTEKQKENAYKVKANLQESIWIENLGNGDFRVKSLPKMAQWSPVQDILIDDFDNDKNLDAMLVGNAYDYEPVAGRYDASVGLILMGDGKGDFEAKLYDKTGFVADGDCKSLISLKTMQGKMYIVSSNSGSLKVFLK